MAPEVVRLSWSSIRWRAALLAATLVSVAVGALAGFAVWQVESGLLGRAGERAQTAVTLLADSTAQQTRAGLDRFQALAHDPAIVDCLRAPGAAALDRARDRLRRQFAAPERQQIDLWTSSGDRLLSIDSSQGEAVTFPPSALPPTVGLSPLLDYGGMAFARIAVDVQGPGGATLGELVRTDSVRAESAGMLNGLVGSGARVLVGNADGTVWTDLTHVAPGPPPGLLTSGARDIDDGHGARAIAASAAIGGTPWAVAVELQRSVVVAPAWQLMRRLAAVGLAFMLIATVAAATLSGRVTRPLGELTAAAQAIAGGEYSRRVAAGGRDELGRLGRAFNAMAEQVAAARGNLEARAEALATARESARRANQAKDDFLAVLSHEMRTPLNAMLGWCQMLREGVVPPNRTARALEVIDRNAKAQLRLVEDLLDMSRIIAGKFDLDLQPTDAASIVRAAIDAIQPVAAAKEVALDVRCAPGGAAIHGDPGRLQQAVSNLLSNALKFVGQGGHIDVSVDRLQGAREIEIVVRDDGEGIEAEDLPYVFDRFRQGDHGPTRAPAGLGLGLAIVQEVIARHGGSVRAESEGAGRGATFRVRLPVPGDSPEVPPVEARDLGRFSCQ